MSAKKSGSLQPVTSSPDAGRAAGERVANGRILRLVRGAPERQALESGQVDAVLDRATGTAFLLPAARRALSSDGGKVANGLLAALPREDYQSLLGNLEPVALAAGEVLYEPGERIRYVYFPNEGQVSLLTMVVVGRKALEVSLVGPEGMIGIPLALGADASPVRALVQGSGSALRMKAASFCEALRHCLPLQHEVRRYAYAKLVQARQIAACNRFHSTEARLARCLLVTRDRVRSDQFHLTHEFLANALGVRRVGVTNAASALQRRKLISYRRGKIHILDRKGLTAASCGCYEIIRNLTS
jgi:CRP-like cAMP-binding protein